MGWTLTEDWLTVVSLLLLTFGTGAQAWDNLAEFRSLRQTVSEVASGAISDAMAVELAVATAQVMGVVGESRLERLMPAWLRIVKVILAGIISIPGELTQLRADGGEEAVQLVRFLRLAKIWTILMIGSALALAAAVIQLALAYQ